MRSFFNFNIPSGLEGSKSLIYFHLTRRTFLIFRRDLSFVTVWNIMVDNMRKKPQKGVLHVGFGVFGRRENPKFEECGATHF